MKINRLGTYRFANIARRTVGVPKRASSQTSLFFKEGASANCKTPFLNSEADQALHETLHYSQLLLSNRHASRTKYGKRAAWGSAAVQGIVAWAFGGKIWGQMMISGMSQDNAQTLLCASMILITLLSFAVGRLIGSFKDRRNLENFNLALKSVSLEAQKLYQVLPRIRGLVDEFLIVKKTLNDAENQHVPYPREVFNQLSWAYKHVGIYLIGLSSYPNTISIEEARKNRRLMKIAQQSYRQIQDTVAPR